MYVINVKPSKSVQNTKGISKNSQKDLMLRWSQSGPKQKKTGLCSDLLQQFHPIVSSVTFEIKIKLEMCHA